MSLSNPSSLMKPKCVQATKYKRHMYLSRSINHAQNTKTFRNVMESQIILYIISSEMTGLHQDLCNFLDKAGCSE